MSFSHRWQISPMFKFSPLLDISQIYNGRNIAIFKWNISKNTRKKIFFENSEEIKIGIYQPIYWIHWFLNQLISYSPHPPSKKKKKEKKSISWHELGTIGIIKHTSVQLCQKVDHIVHLHHREHNQDLL